MHRGFALTDVMKKIHLLFVCLFTAILANAQQEPLKELDLMLKNYNYPYPVQYITVHNQQQELQMAYMDIKPAGQSGKNIMLLHGKNFNGAYFEKTIRALVQNGFRVVVPDQIGFGKSTKPHNFQYTFQQLCANTRVLLDTLKISRIAVLGHSMGGMLATRFALQYPDVTEKLILENPIGLEDWKLKVPYKDVNWWYANELKSSYESIKKYQQENYYAGKWNDEFDRWARLLAGWTINENYDEIAWTSALTYEMIFTQPVLYEFKNISIPTLLIIGTRDKTAVGKPLVPDSLRKTMGNYAALGKKTQKEIPGAQLVEIENIGHLPHIESFDLFIKPLLKFLKQGN